MRVPVPWLYFFALVALFFIGAFLASYRLAESPPPWRDEGIVTQVARNVAHTGAYAVQISPDVMISAGFVTTGYPLIYPVAIALRLFTDDFMAARGVMVGFIILFLVSAYLWVLKEEGRGHAILSLALLVSFAPLYGHGRSVIGEVPGMFFLILFLIAMSSWVSRVGATPAHAVMPGILLGLTMATKPIFLIILIPTLLLWFVSLNRKSFSWTSLLVFIMATLVPVGWWIFVQFGGESLGEILRVYSGNPERVSLFVTMSTNLSQILRHVETLYFLGLLGAWVLGLISAFYRNEPLSKTEGLAVIFSVLVLCAYLTSDGYYRYFFPAQVLTLIYLPLSLTRILAALYSARFATSTAVFMVGALVVFQLYTTLTSSFVANYWNSERAALLSNALKSLPAYESILVYDVPEAVPFLPHDTYYQFAQFALTKLGEKSLPRLLKERIPDTIIIHSGSYEDNSLIMSGYELKEGLGKYSLLMRR